MIHEKFLDDAKVASLTPVGRLLFLSCLLAASGSVEGQAEVTHESLRRQSGVKSQSIQSQLDLLQSFQLLRYDKIEPPLRNRIEEKRKEEKRREENISAAAPPHTQTELLKSEVLSSKEDVKPPLVELWNKFRGALPECKVWGGQRSGKIRSRWREQTPDAWSETIKRMAKSDFCCGKGPTGWRADFDFLLKPDTWAKVNEGRYDNSTGPLNSAQKLKYDNLDRLEQIWSEKGAKNEV